MLSETPKRQADAAVVKYEADKADAEAVYTVAMDAWSVKTRKACRLKPDAFIVPKTKRAMLEECNLRLASGLPDSRFPPLPLDTDRTGLSSADGCRYFVDSYVDTQGVRAKFRCKYDPTMLGSGRMGDAEMNDDEPCHDSEPLSSYPDSGPYCRHWREAWDCDAVCATCGHTCSSHGFDETPSDCEIAGCSCEAWLDLPSPPPPPVVTDAEAIERQMKAQGLRLLADLSNLEPLSAEEATCPICSELVSEHEKHMRFVNGMNGGLVVRGRLHERCAPDDMDTWLEMRALKPVEQ
jgi:hypothetical protein